MFHTYHTLLNIHHLFTKLRSGTMCLVMPPPPPPPPPLCAVAPNHVVYITRNFGSWLRLSEKVSTTCLLQKYCQFYTPNFSASIVHVKILTDHKPSCQKPAWEQQNFTFCWAKSGTPTMPTHLVIWKNPGAERTQNAGTTTRTRNTYPEQVTKWKQVHLTPTMLNLDMYVCSCPISISYFVCAKEVTEIPKWSGKMITVTALWSLVTGCSSARYR